MKSRSIYTLFLTIVALSILGASCSKDKLKRNPGRIYAPDMTYSQAYESYTENPNFANGLTNRNLVEGTVARGDFGYPSFKAGDSAAVFALSNPLEMTKANLDEGKRLFNIYCAPCHGTGLDGNGPLYASGKYPLAPANLKSEPVSKFSVGKYYYTIMFGKNMMGSYASQLTEEQRWKVVGYIYSENNSSASEAGSSEESVNEENTTEEATTEEATSDNTEKK